MAHKLSLKHVQRAPFANVNVKLAAQVLSHTVANGVSNLVHFKVLPAETLHTVHLIEKLTCFSMFSLVDLHQGKVSKCIMP